MNVWTEAKETLFVCLLFLFSSGFAVYVLFCYCSYFVFICVSLSCFSAHFLTLFPHFISSLYFLTLFPHFISSLYFLTLFPHFISTLYFHTLFPHFISSLYFLTFFPHFFFPILSSSHALFFSSSCLALLPFLICFRFLFLVSVCLYLFLCLFFVYFHFLFFSLSSLST